MSERFSDRFVYEDTHRNTHRKAVRFTAGLKTDSTQEFDEAHGTARSSSSIPSLPLQPVAELGQPSSGLGVTFRFLSILSVFLVLAAGIVIYAVLHDSGDDAQGTSLRNHPQPSYSSCTPLSEERIYAEMRAYVDRVLNSRLRDPVGRRDFALHVDGAEVVDDLTVPVTALGLHKDSAYSQSAEVALHDDMHIGSCWRIPNQNGQLAVLLPTLLYPTHVTIDHIPAEIAADIRQAPRSMFLWGIVDGKLNHARYLTYMSSGEPVPSANGRASPPLAGDHMYVLLSKFQYDINAEFHVQTFPVDPRIVLSRMYFGIVVLEIVDNWGSNATCLYRLRVHGTAVDL